MGIILSQSCYHYELFLCIFSNISCCKLKFIFFYGSLSFLNLQAYVFLSGLEISWSLSFYILFLPHFTALLLELQLDVYYMLSVSHIFLMLSFLLIFSTCTSNWVFSIDFFLNQTCLLCKLL